MHEGDQLAEEIMLIATFQQGRCLAHLHALILLVIIFSISTSHKKMITHYQMETIRALVAAVTRHRPCWLV
jgi:hypothetical protein